MKRVFLTAALLPFVLAPMTAMARADEEQAKDEKAQEEKTEEEKTEVYIVPFQASQAKPAAGEKKDEKGDKDKADKEKKAKDDDSKIPAADRLGFQQAEVAAEMAELEQRMFRLGETLKSLEPENSSRLMIGLKFAREELVLHQMKEIQEQLDKASLGESLIEQKQLLSKLERLEQLLLSSDLDFQMRLGPAAPDSRDSAAARSGDSRGRSRAKGVQPDGRAKGPGCRVDEAKGGIAGADPPADGPCGSRRCFGQGSRGRRRSSRPGPSWPASKAKRSKRPPPWPRRRPPWLRRALKCRPPRRRRPNRLPGRKKNRPKRKAPAKKSPSRTKPRPRKKNQRQVSRRLKLSPKSKNNRPTRPNLRPSASRWRRRPGPCSPPKQNSLPTSRPRPSRR